MATNILIPHLNPVRLFKLTNDNFDYLKTKDWDTGHQYCQKFKTTDKLRIQFAVAQAWSWDSMSASLVDIYDNIISNLSIGVVRVANGFEWKEIEKTLTGLSGIFLLKISILEGENEITYYSEPIEITEDENTILLEYSHDENDFDVIFFEYGSQVSKVFQIRVEGGFSTEGFKPASKDSMYIDQTHNAVMLSSIPFNTRELTIGGSLGIPNWLIDKINRIFSCNVVTVDGVGYCKSDGSKFEPTRIAGYTSGGWKIELSESVNQYSLTN